MWDMEIWEYVGYGNMWDMTICGIWGCVGYGNVGDMGICEIWEYARLKLM